MEKAMKFNKTLKQNLMLYLGNYGELSAAITRRAERRRRLTTARRNFRGDLCKRERVARGRH